MSLKVDKWTGFESITINQILEVLNEMVGIDPEFTKKLMTTRFPCNHEMRDHKSIQVHCYDKASVEKPEAGFLGVLNGLIGIDRNHFGAVSAIYNDNDGSIQGFNLTDTDRMSELIEEREAKRKEEESKNRFDKIRNDSDKKED